MMDASADSDADVEPKIFLDFLDMRLGGFLYKKNDEYDEKANDSCNQSELAAREMKTKNSRCQLLGNVMG